MEDFHIDAELLSTLHEASEEDLQALAELHEDPVNDDQIELYIYLCFLIFQKSCNTQSLDQAIQRAEGWAAATAAGHPDHDRRHSIMDTLVAWGHQYRTIEEDVRDESAPLESYMIESARNQVDTMAHLLGEAERLSKRFDQTGRLECFNEAIEKMELAIGIAGEYAPTGMLYHLGTMFGIRFEQTGSTDDINRAISILSEAVDATPHNDPERGARLNTLGVRTVNRYKHKRSMEDLNQAISLLSEAVDATPQNHPSRGFRLSNLGGPLLYRFECKGSTEDLDQAISIFSEAVDHLPHNHPDRVLCLNNLGTGLHTRFQWIGSINDLDRAIDVGREAVDIASHDHPKRVLVSCGFSTRLGERFKRTGSIDDLDEAISVASKAVDATSLDHADRAANLSNLGNFFCLRFKRMGSIEDLTQAISNSSKAVDALPYNHGNRATILGGLGGQLCELFQQTGSIDDCNQAIKVVSEAVDITPLDDPNRANLLTNLARCVYAQGNHTGSMDGLSRIMPMLTESWQCETAPPSQRLLSALLVAKALMQEQDWEQSYQLLREAISLLHTVSPRFSNRTDAQALLTNSFGLASSAVCAALNAGKAPEDALGLLEHGRGVIASLLMDMRGDITDLQRQYPDLAENFSLLRDELDLPSRGGITLASTDKVSSWELQTKRHREANREFNEVIKTIRAQPGFSSFLQPPDVKGLMAAAEQGPVIVLNMDESRCDAFLVQPDSVQVINLPSLKKSEVQHTVTGLLGNSDLSPLLEWLWHTICHPCLNALGIKDAVSDGNWPHIWWIPTGLLSQLPLHAAGIYRPGSKETVLDRAVSSYASSIKALLHGRKHGIQKPRQPPSEDSALIVSMQETPGLEARGRLPFAVDEVHMLRDLCPQLQLASVTPSRNKEDVLKHMPKCKIFHFAGHGQSDPRDPSRSCLLLDDWETNPLTVGDIRDSRLQDDPPFLAYLSACSTGANKVERLADEGIHLISAFQLAGFRHAIGTLWEVSDKHCVDVARILYKTLQEEGMTDLAVSRGLHRALRALRDGDAENVLTRDAKLVRPRPARQGVIDFLWVPYVHFGV